MISNNNRIPISDIKLKTSNVYSKYGDYNFKVLHEDFTFTLVGIENVPKGLFVEKDFNPCSLPKKIQKAVFLANAVLLSGKSVFSNNTLIVHDNIPNWLSEMKQLRQVTFQGILRCSVKPLGSTSMDGLIIDRIDVENRQKVLEEIISFKKLDYFVYRRLEVDEVDFIKKNAPNLKVWSFEEYEERIKKGQFRFDWYN